MFQNTDVQDELEVFRQQWQQELESTPSSEKERQPVSSEVPKEDEPLNDVEKVINQNIWRNTLLVILPLTEML